MMIIFFTLHALVRVSRLGSAHNNFTECNDFQGGAQAVQTDKTV